MPYKFIKSRFNQAFDFRDGTPGLVLLALDRRCRPDTDSHFVTGQYLEHLIRRDKHFSAVRRHRKSVAVLGAFYSGFDVLVLCLEFFSKIFELRHRIAIEHGRYRLLEYRYYRFAAATGEQSPQRS